MKRFQIIILIYIGVFILGFIINTLNKKEKRELLLKIEKLEKR